jgi:hypothetical protein
MRCLYIFFLPCRYGHKIRAKFPCIYHKWTKDFSGDISAPSNLTVYQMTTTQAPNITLRWWSRALEGKTDCRSVTLQYIYTEEEHQTRAFVRCVIRESGDIYLI